MAMGNRATVQLKNDTQDRGVFINWNGGAGSVAAFLEETKLRIGRDVLSAGEKSASTEARYEAEATYFYATFLGVAREFFAYGSQFKERVSGGYMMCSNLSEFSGEDNGNYEVKNDFTCERINIEHLSDYERGNYEGITGFFCAAHHALCTVIEEETKHFKDDFSAEDLKEHLLYAKDIAANATKRVEYIKTQIAEAEAAAAQKAIEDANKPAVEEDVIHIPSP